MKKLHVLFIHKLIFDYRLPFYETIANNLNYDVTVLHSGERMWKPDSKFREIIVPEYSLNGILWQKGSIKAARSADIVISLFDVHYMSTIVLSLLPRNFKLIYWGIGFGHSRFANILRLFLSRKADALALYMPGNMHDFIRSGIPRNKVFCAPNTIHVEKPFFVENASMKDSFLFLGGLKKRKKVDELLKAFQRALPNFTKHIRIDVVGDGEMISELQLLADKLDIRDRVEFHGSITDNEKLAPYFKRAMAIVSPGQAGLTILHGFAHGVPMVTYRNAISGGEMENIIHGENGILYDGSVDELSNILVNLANNPEDVRRLGRNAYEYYMQNMTLNHLVQSFNDIFNFVTKKRS